MKKILLVAVLGTALVSCGGPSVCDCTQKGKEMMKEMTDAKDDAAKKAVEEKYKGEMEACEKLGEGKSPEELKEMMKEAESCK